MKMYAKLINTDRELYKCEVRDRDSNLLYEAYTWSGTFKYKMEDFLQHCIKQAYTIPVSK